jgi:hypothetical protein
VLAYLATSWEQHDARIEVARLGARDLVEANWSSIKAVAEELLRKQALDAAAVKAIVLRCDRDMDSLTYERRRNEISLLVASAVPTEQQEGTST